MTERALKAPRENRRDDCLHCALMDAMEAWFREHGEQSDGKHVIDVSHVISKMAECLVDTISVLPDRSSRRRAVRFAHEAIDAALKSERTGKLVQVDIPAEH